MSFNLRSSILMSMVAGLMTVALTVPSSAAANDAQSAGGVAQVPQLAPIAEPQVLIAGIKFDESMLPHTAVNSQWYWIPNWFAGTWSRQAVTTVSEFDCKSGSTKQLKVTASARSYDQEGWQQDAKNNCWNCDHTPFRTESFGDSYRQIFIIHSVKPLQVTEEKVTKEFIGTGALVDIATGVIKHTAKARSVQTYTKGVDGYMTCKSVTTEYDATGNQTRISNSETEYKQVAEFQPHHQHEGKDMRISFRDFLVARGTANLIPNELASLPAASTVAYSQR